MDIAATLQRLRLQPTSQPHLHVLFLEYPATALLPTRPGIGLRMQPPKAALYRETPNLDKHFLGEQGLDFFLPLKVDSWRPAESVDRSSASIATAIARLSRGGGHSTLEAVTVSDDDHEESGCIFRLTTLWHNLDPKEIHDFWIGEQEWQDLLSKSEAKPWTDLLVNLFTRASDRAYLHVERQLKGTQYFAIDALKWDAYGVSTANELLALNMRVVHEEGTLLCLLPIRELSGVELRVLTVRLPCEHGTTVTIGWLKDLSWAECIDMACPTCGQVILPNRDIMHARHSIERRRRQRNALDQVLWKHVEAAKTGFATRIDTSGALICQALTHALQSMQVPESVSPPQLCPDCSAEAAAILAKARTAYRKSSGIFSANLKDIRNHLMRTVDVGLEEYSSLRNADMTDHIFPGWSVFMRRWLERTIALVAMPSYAGEDVWAVFGEIPDEDICFDSEDVVLGGDVDIGKLLRGVSL
jgi:hypothetical protein